MKNTKCRTAVILLLALLIIAMFALILYYRSLAGRATGEPGGDPWPGEEEKCPCQGCTDDTKPALYSEDDIGIEAIPSGDNIYPPMTSNWRGGC